MKEMLDGLDEEELGMVMVALRNEMVANLHADNLITLQKNIIVY
ncbi:hypothetical protein ABE137_11880 [Brevibacillus laterosporus]